MRIAKAVVAVMVLALGISLTALPPAWANVRSVVPLSQSADKVTTFHKLSTALVTPGLSPGDVIKILPGSSPSHITDQNVDTALADAAGTLTIEGEGAASSAPAIGVFDALTLAHPLRLRRLNLNLLGGSVSIGINATGSQIADCVINNYYESAPDEGVIGVHASGIRIVGNTIHSEAGTPGSDVIQVTSLASSANVIQGNTIDSQGANSQSAIEYTGAAEATGDEIKGNRLFGDTGLEPVIKISSGVQGLKIAGNTINDPDAGQIAINLLGSVKSIKIKKNIIKLSGPSNPIGISVQAGSTASGTDATITGNTIDTKKQGTGIRFSPGTGDVILASVAGNKLSSNAIGVNVLAGGGTSVVGIDLGGGSQGSAGSNDFRGFTTSASSTAGAIVTSALSADGPISAVSNIFSVGNHEKVIFDKDDSATLADVIP